MGASKMAQLVKAHAKPDTLSLVPRTHIVKGESQVPPWKGIHKFYAYTTKSYVSGLNIHKSLVSIRGPRTNCRQILRDAFMQTQKRNLWDKYKSNFFLVWYQIWEKVLKFTRLLHSIHSLLFTLFKYVSDLLD